MSASIRGGQRYWGHSWNWSYGLPNAGNQNWGPLQEW